VSLAAARAAFDARSWRRALELYSTLEGLEREDFDRYAESAMLLGLRDDYFAIRERQHRELLAAGDVVGSAGAALWIGMQRLVIGEFGPGMGWIGRAERMLGEDGTDSVPAVVLRLGKAFEALGGGDLEAALAIVRSAVVDARRLNDSNTTVLALHQLGLFLIESGSADEGLAALDDAMVELAAGDVSPMVTGIIYCGVLHGCWAAYELQRAAQWTAAMTAWCSTQPDLANFTGECKVRRAELKQLNGAWAEALDELQDVSPADVDRWAAGAAAYVRGNLDRLRGRFNDSEESFTLAAKLGYEPQPGLAQLRLMRGSTEAAAAMIRRSLVEVREPWRRIELLFAAVDILLSVADTAGAADAAAELTSLASGQPSPIVPAMAAQAQAQVDLAAGRADSALPGIRAALRTWLGERAPYLEAQARVLLAEACEALGDVDTCARERETARGLFEGLGAAPDVGRLGGGDSLLTGRELEVLRLLATGATNRAIAAELVLSERTVDRHVSNIFGKLGVSTRAAATAYAFEQQLV